MSLGLHCHSTNLRSSPRKRGPRSQALSRLKVWVPASAGTNGIGNTNSPHLALDDGSLALVVTGQQIKSALLHRCASLKPCCQTKVRHIELTPAPSCQCFVDLIEELNGVNIRRGGNAPDNNTSLHLLMLVMVDIGIAPTTCAKLPQIL